MGRANLRGKEKNGGCNLVAIKNDSIFFAERTPGIKTHEVWNRFKLIAIVSDKVYPREGLRITYITSSLTRTRLKPEKKQNFKLIMSI